MKKKETNYEYFDTTADIGIKIESNTINEAFKASAKATLNLITDTEKLEEKITKEIKITSEDEYALLYDWITELLILLDSENYMTKKCNIQITKENDEYKLEGILTGDIYNTEKYSYKTEVKAITYHEMEIKIAPENVSIKFILDL